jgi:formylglycine-generating enzyme required for sulfatase activity
VLYLNTPGFTISGRLYAKTDDSNPNADAITVERSSLPIDSLILSLRNIKSRQIIVLLDIDRPIKRDDNRIFKSDDDFLRKCLQLVASSTGGRVGLMVSCQHGQSKVAEHGELSGPFTKFLIDGFHMAKSSSFDDITAFTSSKMRVWSDDQVRQEPIVIKCGSGVLDFGTGRKRQNRPNNGPSSRLTDYPALKAYVESLRSIPAGTFQMGSEYFGDEKPVHSVTLSAFQLGATPVTVAVWKEYCAATGTSLPKAPGWGLLDDHPVVNVSWSDIMGEAGSGGFCAWASDIAGFRLTLPTEAQWEYAARGGLDRPLYPWGNTFDDSKLWSSVKTTRAATASVLRTSNQSQNAFGLTDMSGNVWQWCSDFYGPYTSDQQSNPTGSQSPSNNRRTVRGGSWNSEDPDVFRCAVRSWFNPDYSDSCLGFRLAAGPG